MKPSKLQPGAIELLDAGFHLLREAPASAWLVWSAGAFPFSLAYIAFTNQMSVSADAAEQLAPFALAIAVLYIWLSCCQTMFAARLRPLLSSDELSTRPVSWGTVIRSQSFLQATSVVLLPAAALSGLGLPWAFAFYQTATCYPYRDENDGIGSVGRYASRGASHWSTSNILMTLCLGLVAFIVFLNVLITLVMLPQLLKMFTGMETIFTRDPQAMLNSTVLSAAGVLGWMVLDPLVKATYVVRSFRLDSIHSGDDLKADLARQKRAMAATAAACLAVMVMPVQLHAQQKPAVDPPQLEQSIRRVLQNPEYAWRVPRKLADDNKNAFIRFSEEAGRTIWRGVRAVAKFIGDVIEWIARWLFGDRSQDMDPGVKGSARAPSGMPAFLLVIAVILAIAAFFLWRRWQHREPVPQAVAAGGPAIDIASEDVSPDQLPDNEWLTMADDFARNGDLRMATRAAYLALLASLGQRGVIRIDRAKSNLDYQRELLRRARANTTLQSLFRDCVRVFERTWYGRHMITADLFSAFRENALKARASAE